MRTLYACVIFLSVNSIALQAWADDYPTAGLVYHTKENSSLEYHCTKRDEVLDCEFTQISVRTKAKPEDLAKRLADAKAQLPAAIKDAASTKSCKATQIMGDVLEEFEHRSRPQKAFLNKGAALRQSPIFQSMSLSWYRPLALSRSTRLAVNPGVALAILSAPASTRGYNRLLAT